MAIDADTERNASDALWLEPGESLPDQVQEHLADPKNSPAAIGERIGRYLRWLLAHPQSHNPSYRERYQRLIDDLGNLTARQAYIVVNAFTGLNSSQGFEQMPERPDLQFPRDHAPKLRSQVGWHFFVGSCWDDAGHEYGVEMMLFRQAALPPELAAEAGLSDLENQIVELQLAISRAGDRHYQADPVVVAGTSGLLLVEEDPLHYQLGCNEIRLERTDRFAPLSVRASGIDRGQRPPARLAIDLRFDDARGVLLQGKDGCMPCIAGSGSLYYSIPGLRLAAGSTLTIAGKQVSLRDGLFWFDHQWGFLSGNSQSEVLRAAINQNAPAPAGWDWFMAQFDTNNSLTMFAPHSAKHAAFYQQTANEPGIMTAPVIGKLMDEAGDLHDCGGTMTVDRWARAERSPDPDIFPATGVWHPARWTFAFDERVPETIRNFTFEPLCLDQSNFFANGAQYREGAVVIHDSAGNQIGRGFAEAVAYADPTANRLRLTGLPDDLGPVIQPTEASLARRIWSFAYLMAHQADLKEVFANAPGSELWTEAS
ncbi:MAG: lipocalin-like domain-containing protein [Dehalococcoidia bacterium]